MAKAIPNPEPQRPGVPKGPGDWDDPLARELAGFGGSLEVVSPEALRQKLGAIGQELLAAYVDPAPLRSYEGQEEP